MAGCIVLNDASVRDILLEMSKSDILYLFNRLSNALRQFSTGTERDYQPAPGSIVRPNGQKVLFRPFTSPASVGTKIIVDPAPVEASDGSKNTKKAPLHGILVMCDKDGLPAGLMNAEEITGFRTSVSALIPWLWRQRTQRIVVFGAGKQALWHIRLALALRGDEIEEITVFNRSQGRAQALVDQFKQETSQRWKADVKIRALPLDDQANMAAKLGDADCIFCTVPSEQPLFAKEHVRNSTPYVSAIGSWQPSMIELHPDLITRGLDGSRGKLGRAEGMIIVDDRDSALSHAGEVVKTGLVSSQIIELGEAVALKETGEEAPQNKDFFQWLENGLVLYKSVGVGLTDLVAGEAILELARKRSDSFPSFEL